MTGAQQLNTETGSKLSFFYSVFPWFAGFQIVLILVMFWQVSHRSLPVFLAVTPGGEERILESHEHPSTIPLVLLRWAGMAAVSAYTFDFVNYSRQTEQAHTWFTEKGWRDYQASVKDLIQTITARQLFVSSVVSAPPVIAKTDDSGWEIQLPFLVTYQSSDNRTRQAFLVRMKVVRVPADLNASGLGVDEFIMASAS